MSSSGKSRFAEGLLYLALGEFASAGESFHLAFSGQPSPYEHLSLEFSLAVVKAGLGQADAAMQELEAIAGQARQAGLGYVFLPAGLAQAWLWAGHGQANKALQLLDQLDAVLSGGDARGPRARGRVVRAGNRGVRSDAGRRGLATPPSDRHLGLPALGLDGPVHEVPQEDG